MGKKTFKVISKRSVFQKQYAKVEEWQVVHRDNSRHSYLMAHLRGDAVFVFALTRDKKVVVLRQFFMSAEKRVWTLVAGLVEDHHVRQTAARELREETGYAADKFVYLGKTLKGKWSLGYYHFFLAIGARRVGNQQLEESEDIRVQLMSQRQFRALLRRGELHDVAAVECAYRALDYLSFL